MEKQATLILASSSPRRRELIQTLGLPVVIRASEADETVKPGLTPAQIVETLSVRKAEAVRSTLARDEGTVVIGSDTIVVLDDRVLGKPKDETEAAEMLGSLQGRAHEVFSGVAVMDVPGRRTETAHRRTKVYMKPLSADQIASYIRTGEPRDKAGAYAIQGIGATIVEGIEGDYFNVVGLPLALLAELLGRFHIRVL